VEDRKSWQAASSGLGRGLRSKCDYEKHTFFSLFDDSEADVREAASECFQYFTGEHLAQ
jgi:hypothetical protein